LEWATQTGRHALGPLSLQSGATLPAAELSWKTYGALAPARDNVIVYPTRACGFLTESGLNEAAIAAGS